MSESKKYPSNIETPKLVYIVEYPAFEDIASKQASIFWTAEELGVEKDANDVLVKFTEGERAGLKTVQSILTQYELMIGGEEIWGGKIYKLFPRPEIQRLCHMISCIEICTHAPFYDLINKTLNIATEEFYTQWQRDPVLAQRIEFIEEKVDSDDPLLVTAAVAFLEGVALYSAFGFFKAFNSRGFEFIKHFVAGIDASAKDENFHAMASSLLFKTCLQERDENGRYNSTDIAELSATIYEMAQNIYEHELQIIERIFEVGGIRVLKKEELIDFVQDRVNVVLAYLGYSPLFEKETGVITEWFYNQLNAFKYSDFFAAKQVQYTRNWSKAKLGFKK